MTFIVDQEIWNRFPGMLLVVVYATACNNEIEAPEITEELRKAQQNISQKWQHQNAQSHPRIAIWRDAFQKGMNLSGKNFPSSIEAMCRRILTGKGVGSINPLVDFYNSVSLRFVLPIGGWDVDDVYGGDIYLRLTKSEERFTELGNFNFIYAQEGEIAYTDADEIITRHFVWRQSETAKITPQTKRIFLVSELLPPIDRDIGELIRVALCDGLKKYFGALPVSKIMSDGENRWDWD